MLDWLDSLLLPTDDKPETIRRHQFRVAFSTCLAWAILSLFVIPAMLLGLPKLGQLAWAADVAEEVDTKVEAAVRPLKEQVNRIEATVAQQAQDTGEVIVSLLASELRAAAAARCLAPPGRRERENREIEELQRKYIKRTGSEYDIPSCNEL